MKKINKANIELHVHPRLDINSMEDVLRSMDKTRLNVLGLSALDESIYPLVVEETKKIYGSLDYDSAGITLPNGNYILNVREYNTQEGLHILTAGYSYNQATSKTEIREIIEKGLENRALVLLDHPFVDNIFTKTAGHISSKLEEELVKLCEEFPGKITLEWNGYCKPWMRWGLKPILNLLGYKTDYHNVNKKAKELAKNTQTPILADTDLHARNKKALNAMGAAKFITDLEGETALDIVDSMNKNIFSGNYENVEKYVGNYHMLRYFCLPILFDKFFSKPRA